MRANEEKNYQSTPAQVRILSAVAVAGIESILNEVSQGEIDSQAAIGKIRTLLQEHGDQVPSQESQNH